MRLVDMGVEPYLVSSALTLVAGQRLARRLCENFAVPNEKPDYELLHKLGADDALLEGATFIARSVARCVATPVTGDGCRCSRSCR